MRAWLSWLAPLGALVARKKQEEAGAGTRVVLAGRFGVALPEGRALATWVVALTLLVPALVVLEARALWAQEQQQAENGRIFFLESRVVEEGIVQPPDPDCVDACYDNSFVNQQDLASMNPDGGMEQLITNDAGRQVGYKLSPDNTKAAFECDDGTDLEICVVNVDGTGEVKVTDNSFKDVGPVSWSPDSTKLAFERERLTADGNPYESDVFVVNADGTGERNLTADTRTREQLPAWSPDGAKVAFMSYPYEGDGADKGDVFVVNADGTGRTNLTNSPQNFDTHPRWSPDGSRIAFVSDRLDAEGIAHNGTYVMGADGADQKQIAEDGQYPVWSPDGTRLAYETSDIYVANADGTGDRVNLTAEIPEDSLYLQGTEASWSPDGTKVAFRGEGYTRTVDDSF